MEDETLDPFARIEAAKEITRIEARQAKLRGLDKPTKTESKVDMDVNTSGSSNERLTPEMLKDFTTEEIATLIKAQRAMLIPRSTEPPRLTSGPVPDGALVEAAEKVADDQ